MFIFVILCISLAAAKNLTLSSYYQYSFGDNAFAQRYDAEYLKGKHCAHLYLGIDHNTVSDAVQYFRQCVEAAYPAAFEDYELTTLTRTFATMFGYFDSDFKNTFLYDEQQDNLYQTFVDIQHDFASFKVDVVSSARRFVHPVFNLNMASSPYQGQEALNQSLDVIDHLRTTVHTLAAAYNTVIQSHATALDNYKTKYLAARVNLETHKNAYENNVTAVLQRLTVRPSATIPCQAGFYCHNASHSAACPAGTFQPKTNVLTSLACTQTPMYTYATAGAANWTSCPSNTFAGGTVCHLRTLGEVLASMDAAGPIAENFYIAYDLTQQYITAADTLLNASQTASAAAATDALGPTIQALVAGGLTTESAYNAVLVGALQSTYGTSTYVGALNETDLTSANVVAQTNLTRWYSPYIDGSTHYNLTLTSTTWAVFYVDGTNDVAILSGTRSGNTLTGGVSSTRGMIEFPVSSGLAYGYPVVSNTGDPIHSYTLKP